jgi:hypothetical protein
MTLGTPQGSSGQDGDRWLGRIGDPGCASSPVLAVRHQATIYIAVINEWL